VLCDVTDGNEMMERVTRTLGSAPHVVDAQGTEWVWTLRARAAGLRTRPHGRELALEGLEGRRSMRRVRAEDQPHWALTRQTADAPQPGAACGCSATTLLSGPAAGPIR
jgi:hypothetical protein